MDKYPKRGEVWWIAFDPSVGGEIQKTRPAIVVSNDTSNKHLNRVQVIPLTSNVSRLYPAECLVVINGVESKAIASQLTTASTLRLKQRLATVSAEDMKQIEVAIKLQLGL
jgi:mRNA interferase MazF